MSEGVLSFTRLPSLVAPDHRNSQRAAARSTASPCQTGTGWLRFLFVAGDQVPRETGVERLALS